MATSTANYSLPQWANNEEFKVIGQLNPAFSVVDAEMKKNADAAAAADANATEAIGNAATAEQHAQAAKSAADTASKAAQQAQATAHQALTAAQASVQYSKVKLVEDTDGNGVIVTLGKVL